MILMRAPIQIRTLLLYKVDIEHLKPVECKLPVEIEVINKNNVSKALDFREPNVEASFKNMLDSGETGIFGIMDGKAAAHAWAVVNNSNTKKVLEPFYKTGSRVAYIHFCYVREDLRGNNLYPYLLNNLMKTINKTYGIRTFYGDIDEHNISSQNGAKKIGFELVRRYKFISVGGHIINKRNIN